MPVVFALDDAESYDRVVYLAKGLVPPFIGANVDEFLYIDNLKRLMEDVEVGLVGKIFDVLFRIHAFSLTAEDAEIAEKRAGFQRTISVSLPVLVVYSSPSK
jgi:hypothetical protein